MPVSTSCFSSPANVLPCSHGRTTSACFSYSADEPSGQPGRTNSTCFSYQVDISPGAGTGDAVPSRSRGTSSTCFRY